MNCSERCRMFSQSTSNKARRLTVCNQILLKVKEINATLNAVGIAHTYKMGTGNLINKLPRGKPTRY